MTDRATSAADLRSAADDLRRASEHCLIAAVHLDGGDVPRMAAHALAAQGDLHRGRSRINQVAERHARHASIAPREERT